MNLGEDCLLLNRKSEAVVAFKAIDGYGLIIWIIIRLHITM